MYQEVNSSEIPHYLCGYECRLPGSRSKMYVIRLDENFGINFEQLLFTTNSGTPIIYIEPHMQLEDDREQEPDNIQSTNKALNGTEWVNIQEIIDTTQVELFRKHTNLIAIYSEQIGNQQVVIFTVVCKGFIPFGEYPLPTKLCGFKTKTIEGWFYRTSGSNKSFCNPIHPGCGIVSSNKCYLKNYGDMSEHCECTFGTLGGFLKTPSTTYGVTVGHLFQGCNLKTSVMHTTSLCLLYEFLSCHGVSNEEFDALKKCHGFKEGLKKSCHFAERDVEDCIKFANDNSKLCEIGQLHGYICGNYTSNENNVLVTDIALIEMSTPFLAADSFIKYRSFDMGRKLDPPPMTLEFDKTINRCNIFDGENEADTIEIHGLGAKSSKDIRLKLRPSPENKVYIRSWSEEIDKEPVFLAYHAISYNGNQHHIQPGDSGTWFWSNGGKLVGMGIGYLVGNKYWKSIILPMETIAQSIEHMM